MYLNTFANTFKNMFQSAICRPCSYYADDTAQGMKMTRWLSS